MLVLVLVVLVLVLMLMLFLCLVCGGAHDGTGAHVEACLRFRWGLLLL